MLYSMITNLFGIKVNSTSYPPIQSLSIKIFNDVDGVKQRRILLPEFNPSIYEYSLIYSSSLEYNYKWVIDITTSYTPITIDTTVDESCIIKGQGTKNVTVLDNVSGSVLPIVVTSNFSNKTYYFYLKDL
jgi:hypothetical protein